MNLEEARFPSSSLVAAVRTHSTNLKVEKIHLSNSKVEKIHLNNSKVEIIHLNILGNSEEARNPIKSPKRVDRTWNQDRQSLYLKRVESMMNLDGNSSRLKSIDLHRYDIG